MTNWQDNKGIGHTVLDSDEFPVFEKRDLRPDLLDDKPISPPILPATKVSFIY